MNLLSANEATQIIQANVLKAKVQEIDFDTSLGFVLAEDLYSDRDFPPFDRVTMDGIALNYDAFIHNPLHSLFIEGLQAAGDKVLTLGNPKSCFEVMTGAVLPVGTDTVVRYEDITVEADQVIINTNIIKGQNIHYKGQDLKKGAKVLVSGKQINAADIAIIASIGKHKIAVKKPLSVAIISSGDELVPVDQLPENHQIRTSNIYAIKGLLEGLNLKTTLLHIRDDYETTVTVLQKALHDFDVLILSGGVSMGKKDFIPKALKCNNVEELFHKIAQKPGKPMWFGRSEKTIVFALPGNPVSTFMCTIRYVLPWFAACLGTLKNEPITAILTENIVFKPNLTYFLQSKVVIENGINLVYPQKHNGSGDFISLSNTNAFVELPATTSDNYPEGGVYQVYLF